MKGGVASPYGDFKGHLGVKSSPLSPTSSKLTSQYIVLDHLNAHYRRINNAKSAIDNKAPRAMSSSTKARDRVRRNQAKKGLPVNGRSAPNSRPSSRMSIASHQSYADQIHAYEEYFDDDPEVGAIVKGTLPHQHAQPNQDIYIERANTEDMKFVNRMVADSYNNPNLYKSPRPMKSMIPDTIKAGSGNPAVTPRRGNAGDLLDDHAHKFKEGKAFTPRTLNTKNVQSKLSQFKYYNPPKKRSTSSKGSKKSAEERFEKTETMNTMATTQDLTFEPLRSKDFNQLSSHREKSANIPRLDISVDQDHMVWLSEQAAKAHVRSGSARRTPEEVQRENAALNHTAGSMNHTAGLGNTTGSINHTAGLRTSDTFQSSRSYREGVRSGDIVTASDTLEREEELKYLEFVSDVTSDVLDRGIFTNRVLKQVFEQHIEKKKHELKMSRMRALLDKLRDDLGIPESDGEAEEDFGYKRNIKLYDDEVDSGKEAYVPKPQPRMQAQPQPQIRHKFVKVTDEVDYKSASGSEASVKKPVEKRDEAVLAKKMENINLSMHDEEPITASEERVVHSAFTDVVSNTIEESDEAVVASEHDSVISEQEDSMNSNMDEMSTNRSLPQEHKWMKDANNFTMTLKPGQLDMTLVKPKPKSRSQPGLAETVPANPRARRREHVKHVEENDDLGTTGEMSSLTDITPMGTTEIHGGKSEASGDVTPRNESETGSVIIKGSYPGSPVGSQASLRSAGQLEEGFRKESRPGSPRGSIHGSVRSGQAHSPRGSTHGSVRRGQAESPRGSTHGSVRSLKAQSPRGSAHGSASSFKASSVHHEVNGSHQPDQTSDLGSTGTLKGSLEGSSKFLSMNATLGESPKLSPRGSIKGSQASVRTGDAVSIDNDSVFSDHIPGLDSEPDDKPHLSYASKSHGHESDDDF